MVSQLKIRSRFIYLIMRLKDNTTERKSWYQMALKKLNMPSKENLNIIITHLFHLKVNEDFVINSFCELEELVSYINQHDN